ncbi:Transcription factor bHLH25, partial [Mucuna pruriens]
MDESLEKWLSYVESEECHLFNEVDMMEEFKLGENSVQPELCLEQNITSLIQHAPSEKLHFSSYNLSFEDSIEVPYVIPKETCQQYGEHSKRIHEEADNGKSKRGRSFSQNQDHILAERKRRENLACMFVALSAMIPGLKKMDKLTILSNAIDHVKYLQKRVKDLEEQNKREIDQPIVCFKMNNVCAVADDVSCTSHDRPIKICPKVEARVSAKDVLIRVLCEKQKNILPKILAKLKSHNLSIVCSNVLPFGNSALNITSVAQVHTNIICWKILTSALVLILSN